VDFATSLRTVGLAHRALGAHKDALSHFQASMAMVCGVPPSSSPCKLLCAAPMCACACVCVHVHVCVCVCTRACVHVRVHVCMCACLFKLCWVCMAACASSSLHV
jgi:hypothetical protein